jgi:hypothetical protein
MLRNTGTRGKRMDNRIKFLTIAYMTTFLACMLIFAYRVIEIGQVENNVKNQYATILANYSCVPKATAAILNKDRSCIRNGYWYPECPKDELNFSGGR